MLQDGDCSKIGLAFKVLFQRGEMIKRSRHQVEEHSYYSNMSTIMKLSLKCQVVFIITDNVYL